MVIHRVDTTVAVGIMKGMISKLPKIGEKIELVSYHGNQNRSKCKNYTRPVRDI